MVVNFKQISQFINVTYHFAEKVTVIFTVILDELSFRDGRKYVNCCHEFHEIFLHLILLGMIITWHFHLLHLFAFQDLYMTHQIVLPKLIFDFRIFDFLEFLPGLSHTLPNTIFIKNNNLKCILVF